MEHDKRNLWILAIVAVLGMTSLYQWNMLRQPDLDPAAPDARIEVADRVPDASPPRARSAQGLSASLVPVPRPVEAEPLPPVETPEFAPTMGEDACGWLVSSALASVPADAGETVSPYFFVPTDDPTVDALPLKSTRVDVAIAGVMADVRVTQVYKNEGDRTLEAVYLFPSSTRSAVHSLKMTVGHRVIEATIRERQQARQEYKQAVEQGQTASLLEQQRPNVFQMVVGNILPGDEIQVELAYAELLVPEDNVYEFVYPTVVGPRYSNIPKDDATPDDAWLETPYTHEGQEPTYTFGLSAVLNSGVPIAEVTSPSHDIAVLYRGARTANINIDEGTDTGDRDVVLRYRLAGDVIQSGLLLYPGEEESYFLLMMEPPARVEIEQVVPREYIFIMDVSGSMNGFPIDVSKQLMSDLVSSLRPGDYFNVLLFAGGSAVLSEYSLQANAANIQAAVDLIDHQAGGGGTELLPALERALALPRTEGTSRIVVVASDGYVGVEQEAFRLIRENLGVANLFSFGIGSSVNRELIESVARAGQGEPFVVLDAEDGEAKADQFREYVSSPLMQGVEVSFNGFGASAVSPGAVPDLFALRPLVLYGKYDGNPEGEIVVTGRTPTASYRKVIQAARGQVSDRNEPLKYLWARQKIRQLSDDNAVVPSDETVAEITQLGLRYSLLTRYTSFVAVDRLVRATPGSALQVKQPLPLPRGVSDLAVGVCNAVGGEGEILGSQYGSGGYGAYGKGLGGGGSGSGLGGLGSAGHGSGASGYGSGGGFFSKKSQMPRSVAGDPIILGAIDKSAIDRVIKQHLAQIRYCYQKQLQQHPDLEGKVTIKFTIAADGSVSSVAVKETTLNNDTVEQCICGRILRLTFPQPKGAGVVVVTYPFVFRAR